MTEQRTNATIAKATDDIRNLQYIRVTSLKEFDECPDRWRIKYLEGIMQAYSKAADVGTAVHELVDMHISSLHNTEIDGMEFDTQRFQKNFEIIPKNEAPNVIEYLKNLELLSEYELLGCELEFEMKMFDDMPPIRGHIDAIYRDKDMNILIVDHKTNRQHNNESWWADQLQPQLYAWAIGHLFDNRGITFRIGYVNLGYNIEWHISPEDTKRTIHRVRQLWDKMIQYSHKYEEERVEYLGAHWPRTINAACQWCPIKTRCHEYNESLTNFAKSFELRMTMTLTEQLAFTQNVKKIVAAKEDELQAEIRSQIDSSPNGEFIDGDTIWQSQQKTQRHIIPSAFLGVLGMMLKNDVLSPEVYTEHLDEMFTVKVTGVDGLIKRQKELRNIIEPIILQKNVGSGTLKSSKVIGGVGRLNIKPAAKLLSDTTKGID